MQNSKQSYRLDYEISNHRRCCSGQRNVSTSSRKINLSHTQPDIAHAVSLISQFMHSPKEVHLQEAHQVRQYIKGTLGKGILFKRNGGLVLRACSDVDYVGSLIDRRSTSGFAPSLARIW